MSVREIPLPHGLFRDDELLVKTIVIQNTRILARPRPRRDAMQFSEDPIDSQLGKARPIAPVVGQGHAAK